MKEDIVDHVVFSVVMTGGWENAGFRNTIGKSTGKHGMLSFHGYASSIRFNPTRGIMNINCFIAAINTAINRCQDVRCRFDTDFIIHVKGGSLFFFVRLRTSRLLREKRYSIWHEVGSSLAQPRQFVTALDYLLMIRQGNSLLISWQP